MSMVSCSSELNLEVNFKTNGTSENSAVHTPFLDSNTALNSPFKPPR